MRLAGARQHCRHHRQDHGADVGRGRRRAALRLAGLDGRAGYDTPNGTFKANRMDADHLSQEWDNAPMPHTMFFDMRGHAIHGFFDVKHLGLPVSHGCGGVAGPRGDAVPADQGGRHGASGGGFRPHAGGSKPGGGAARCAGRETAAQPMQIAPDYGQQPPTGSNITGSRSPITHSSLITASRSLTMPGGRATCRRNRRRRNITCCGRIIRTEGSTGRVRLRS